MASSTLVRYRQRASGEIIEEAIFSERTLRWFYEHPIGSLCFRGLLNNRAFCDWYGRQMDRPSTADRIPGFVARFGICRELIALRDAARDRAALDDRGDVR